MAQGRLFQGSKVFAETPKVSERAPQLPQQAEGWCASGRALGKEELVWGGTGGAQRTMAGACQGHHVVGGVLGLWEAEEA